MGRRVLFALLALAFSGPGQTARAEVLRVWATDDGEKIRPRGGSPAANSVVFDDRTREVHLFGLPGETVAFQVVVESGAQPTNKVAVRLDSIGPITNLFATDDPDRYFVGRHIEIFEERYLAVTERSHDLAWRPKTEAAPEGFTGPVPDLLVPHREPLTVDAELKQAFWIDVWIPRGTPSGVPRGKLVIEVDGVSCGRACELTVDLDVGRVEMPEKPAVATMLWFSGGSEDPKWVLGRYFADPSRATADELVRLRRRHYHLAQRHGITLFWGKDTEPTTELEELVTGITFTRERGYEGPGDGIGQDVLAFHTYGGELSAEESRRWLEWIERTAAGITAFLYVMDEPREQDFAEINRRASAARPMPSFVTHGYDARLQVDIFAAPAQSYRRDEARMAEAAGRRHWIYNGMRPYSGSFVIDDVAISPRVNPWIQFAEGIPRWFYWEATYYYDSQGKRGQIDVVQNPLNFGNRHGDRMNGDGLLMYPGRDFLFPESDLGIDRPLPSIRLKNWRRGIQDVAYLELARRAGHGEAVDELLATLLPQTLEEVDADDPVSWPEDGQRWNLARRYLFELLRDGESKIRVPELGRPKDSLATQLRRFLRTLFGSKRRIAASALLVASGVLASFWLLRRRRAASR